MVNMGFQPPLSPAQEIEFAVLLVQATSNVVAKSRQLLSFPIFTLIATRKHHFPVNCWIVALECQSEQKNGAFIEGPASPGELKESGSLLHLNLQSWKSQWWLSVVKLNLPPSCRVHPTESIPVSTSLSLACQCWRSFVFDKWAWNLFLFNWKTLWPSFLTD